MSSVSALKIPSPFRSVSSRPCPTYWRPLYTVSAPLTVKLSGAMARASSLTVPRSKIRRSPAESAGCLAGWKTQNSRKSSLVRSTPVGLSDVTIDRQRGRKSRRGRVQRAALLGCTMPPAVSACSVRYMIGLRLSPLPGDAG